MNDVLKQIKERKSVRVFEDRDCRVFKGLISIQLGLNFYIFVISIMPLLPNAIWQNGHDYWYCILLLMDE